jgi:hypothetical protein
MVMVDVEVTVSVAVEVVVSVVVNVAVLVVVEVAVKVAVLVGVGEGLAMVTVGPVALPETLAPLAAITETPAVDRLAVMEPVPDPVKLKSKV